MNRVLGDHIVHFTVVESEFFGDIEGCVTVEILRTDGGWCVSASPTRSLTQRGLSLWVDENGTRRVFASALSAMAAVQEERPNTPLRWHKKICLKPPLSQQTSY